MSKKQKKTKSSAVHIRVSRKQSPVKARVKKPNLSLIFKWYPHVFVIFLSILLVLGLGVFLANWFNPNLFSKTIEIISTVEETNAVKFDAHPITGQRCRNSKVRPMAVMLSEDTVTRPLSGVSKADVVVEMPVVKDGITRMMAIFACEEPEEIGSVRSSRDDFIPLAAAFDAIYVHWGGSHFALDKLNIGVIDNIDALINPFNVFFRKNTIAAPHNGFTSYQQLYDVAERLGYRMETNFEGYSRTDGVPSLSDNPVTVSVEYPRPFNVSYVYNLEENIYYRWRGGIPEYDNIDGSQVSMSVLVIMKTSTRNLEGEYNDVDVIGEGEALVFQNGHMERVKWQKAENLLTSKIKFLNEKGNEISFVPGKMWIHIVDTYTNILWGDDKV